MFEQLITLAITNIITLLVSIHVNRIRNNKRYRETIFQNFETINKHIKIIITALCRSNGFGDRFEQEYNAEILNTKTRDELQPDLTNNR